eukprot:Rmarinus@m.6804
MICQLMSATKLGPSVENTCTMTLSFQMITVAWIFLNVTSTVQVMTFLTTPMEPNLATSMMITTMTLILSTVVIHMAMTTTMMMPTLVTLLMTIMLMTTIIMTMTLPLHGRDPYDYNYGQEEFRGTQSGILDGSELVFVAV